MFGWFKTRPPRTLQHPELGSLSALTGRLWTVEFDFEPTQSSISLFIENNPEALAGAPAAIREFARRYHGLKSAFAVELRPLLQGWQTEPLPSGEALFDRFALSALHLDASPFPVVEFCLKQGWDDAGFRVGLDEWTPRLVGVDD